METFLDPNGSKEKKQENPSTDNYPSTDNSDNDYPLRKKNSNDNNYLLKKKKMPTAKTILKMKEKYGGTENFVQEGTPPKEKNGKVESKDTSSSYKKLDKTVDVINVSLGALEAIHFGLCKTLLITLCYILIILMIHYAS